MPEFLLATNSQSNARPALPREDRRPADAPLAGATNLFQVTLVFLFVPTRWQEVCARPTVKKGRNAGGWPATCAPLPLTSFSAPGILLRLHHLGISTVNTDDDNMLRNAARQTPAMRKRTDGAKTTCDDKSNHNFRAV